MVFILGSSMTSEQFDVNASKLWSTSKDISAQSNLVDYEHGVRASQFMDYGEEKYEQPSSCEWSSQQSSCSIGLQQHQDRQSIYARLLSRSGELSSQSVSGFVLLH